MGLGGCCDLDAQWPVVYTHLRICDGRVYELGNVPGKSLSGGEEPRTVWAFFKNGRGKTAGEMKQNGGKKNKALTSS